MPKLSPEKSWEKLQQLGQLDHASLKSEFKELTGKPPPKRIGTALLKLAVAYEIQTKGHSKIVARVQRRLNTLARRNGNLCRPKRKMKPGGRLVRKWRGNTYEVYVARDGVYLDGKNYNSLSAVAFAITGAKWNGPRFFGLRSPRIEQEKAS